jgi:hypothetical protein
MKRDLMIRGGNSMTEITSTWLNEQQVCELFNRSRQTIWRYRQQGLRHFKVANGAVYFTPEAIDEFLLKQERT